MRVDTHILAPFGSLELKFIIAPQMYGELYAYRLADGLLVRLTHDKWEDGLPTWVTCDVEVDTPRR